MNIIETKNLIEHLDYLLRSGKAGTASEIAKKLGVSERTVRCYFEQMASLNIPVEYDYTIKTWKYSRPGRLSLCFIEDKANYQAHIANTPNLPPINVL